LNHAEQFFILSTKLLKNLALVLQNIQQF